MKQLASGELYSEPMIMGAFNDGETPEEIELKHLSKSIDAILTRTIYEGAEMSLEDGLEFEARQFGECMKTDDMKIGLKNFLENGPKVKAEFMHR